MLQMYGSYHSLTSQFRFHPFFLSSFIITFSAQAVLSGCSAGGLTAILHCDKFRALLPVSTKVKCFADAGYFINA